MWEGSSDSLIRQKIISNVIYTLKKMAVAFRAHIIQRLSSFVVCVFFGIMFGALTLHQCGVPWLKIGIWTTDVVDLLITYGLFNILIMECLGLFL